MSFVETNYSYLFSGGKNVYGSVGVSHLCMKSHDLSQSSRLPSAGAVMCSVVLHEARPLTRMLLLTCLAFVPH